MRKFLPVLLLWWGIGCPTLAQTTLSVVASNSELAALPAATTPVVLRLGFYGDNDGGSALYHGSADRCSLNGGNGDHGSQVRSVPGGCFIADFSFVAPNVRQWGAKGDCMTDDAPAIAAALATGLKIHLPQGDFLIDTPIVASTRVELEGEGWSEIGLNQNPVNTSGCTTAPGSYLSVKNPSVTAFVISGTAGWSATFRHLAILEKQPAIIGPDWSPTVYPPAWDFKGMTLSIPGPRFEDIGLSAVYAGIYAEGNTSRIQMNTIYGQVFSYLLKVDNGLDVSRASDVHMWGYWSMGFGPPYLDYAYNWQQSNQSTFIFKRQDSFEADNIFVLGAKACVQLSQQTTGRFQGPPTAIHFGNLNCDVVKHAIWVDGTSSKAVAAVAHLWVGGETCCSAPAPVAGGNAIEIDGSAATIDVGDMHLTAVAQSAVNITAAGRGSIVRIGSVDADGGMNYGSSGLPFTGTSPFFNVADATTPSEISLSHPARPQNGGYTVGGKSSGIINIDSNALLFATDQSWFAEPMKSGRSYAWPNWAENLLATSVSRISSVRLALPFSPLNGRHLTLVCAANITELTVASVFAIKNAPTTCTAGQRVAFQFIVPTNAWWASW